MLLKDTWQEAREVLAAHYSDRGYPDIATIVRAIPSSDALIAMCDCMENLPDIDWKNPIAPITNYLGR